MGYRLFTGLDQAHRVGCLVLAGRDFLEAVRKQLLAWGTSLVLETSESALSTRGLLEYEDDTFGPKKFKYTCPPLKASPADLLGTPLLSAEAFHILATPSEILSHIPELLKLRGQHGIQKQPFIVWEPLPSSCTLGTIESFRKACALVDIFSPNHLEMLALFNNTPPATFDASLLETYASHISKTGIVIVRAGEHGSLTVRGAGERIWLTPYYKSGAPEVIDPTGAGNAFLGGFMHGWKKTGDLRQASAYGNVAASFAVEQVGLPRFKSEEYWNGVRVGERLERYGVRLE